MIQFRGAKPAADDRIILTSFRKSPVPTIESEHLRIPGRPGILLMDRRHAERIITATFELNGKSAAANEALAVQLARWAESSAPGQLVHPERPEAFYLAQLAGMSEPDLAEAFPTIDVDFICADPYAYSLAEQSAQVGTSFTVQGDVPALPVITLVPTSNLAGGIWVLGGQTISILGYTLQAGHSIVIDCAKRVITDNGQPDAIMQKLSLQSDWITLSPGSRSITGPGGTITWRTTWL